MELKLTTHNRKYESVIIFHPDANEKDQKAFFKRQKDILKQFKGDFTNVDTWGKRRLANPINKLRMGTYFHTVFEAQPECVAELERVMRINDQILRFQHTRMDDRKTAAQHLEDYRNVLKESIEREQDREKAFQQRKLANKQRK